jgi:carbonic anhydrase
MMDDVDVTCLKTVEAFRAHPLIPKDVTISGWIWEVETRRLRAPRSDKKGREATDVTAADFGVKGHQPARWV